MTSEVAFEVRLVFERFPVTTPLVQRIQSFPEIADFLRVAQDTALCEVEVSSALLEMVRVHRLRPAGLDIELLHFNWSLDFAHSDFVSTFECIRQQSEQVACELFLVLSESHFFTLSMTA